MDHSFAAFLAATAALFRLSMILKIVAILLLAMIAGSTFGIWRGYDPANYSSTTFLEVHKGAVSGLNILLPAIAMACIVVTALLAFQSYHQSPAFFMYLIALALLVAGGAITRLINQPINADVMAWTASAMPANWTEVRDHWWVWHVIRTYIAGAALLTLLMAVLMDRPAG